MEITTKKEYINIEEYLLIEDEYVLTYKVEIESYRNGERKDICYERYFYYEGYNREPLTNVFSERKEIMEKLDKLYFLDFIENTYKRYSLDYIKTVRHLIEKAKDRKEIIEFIKSKEFYAHDLDYIKKQKKQLKDLKTGTIGYEDLKKEINRREKENKEMKNLVKEIINYKNDN